jgi:hypothetical protein
VGGVLTFDIPQTALVATLDTYDFVRYIIIYYNAYIADISIGISRMVMFVIVQ